MSESNLSGSPRLPKSEQTHRTGLVTLVFTDMVGSTAIKQQLGDKAGAAFFDRHHEVVRQTRQSFPGSQEIETAGDSFLITFGTPSDAVKFGVLLQTRLRFLSQESGVTTADRIGIHVGEVVFKRDSANARPKDLYGIQIDACARVMSLAQAGQVLMTRAVFDSARQVLKGEDIPGVGQLEWLNHGNYLLKGLDEPVEIGEVRVQGQENRGPPRSSEKAQRQIRAGEEPVLGWRPALGQVVPNTRWVLEMKLGEGGFGEVWLGRHQAMKERRVFKFCFQADRVRSLKREMTLFRLLKERVGEHPHIVALREVNFDEPPFYVEMDYVEGHDLSRWCQGQGGVEQVPLTTKLEIISQAADALQAAHDAGVIHRDVKPGNILVENSRSVARVLDSVQVKLSDFGIGQVLSEESLAGVTRAGFTQTVIAAASSSHTGTQMYMAPELLAGNPASIRSDIYSLGVVLFQLVVNDLNRPVTTDWGKDVLDPLLREDLQQCFAGKPEERFAGAKLLARNLRGLPERQTERAREQAVLAAKVKAAYRRGLVRASAAAAIVIALLAGLGLTAITQAHRANRLARQEAEQRSLAQASELSTRRHLYAAQLYQAQQLWKDGNIKRAAELLNQQRPEPGREDLRGFEWRYLWRLCQDESLFTFTNHVEVVQALAVSQSGRIFATASHDGTAKLWDVASRREIATFNAGAGLRSIALSPDEKLVAVGGWAQTLKLYDVATQAELAQLQGHELTIENLSFSPDGTLLVSAGVPDGTLKIWDVATRKLLRSLPEPTNERPWVAFSPDGKMLASTRGDKTLRLWNTSTWEMIASLPGHESYAVCVVFSPNGRTLASCSMDGTVKLWDVASLRELVVLHGHKAWVSSVSFSADGEQLATTCVDGTIKLWNVSTRQEVTTLKGHSAWISKAAFLLDGRTLLSISDDRTIKLWNTVPTPAFEMLRGHTFKIHSSVFSPDGRLLATGSDDRTIRVWELSTHRETARLVGHQGSVRGVAFSPDGALLVSTSDDRSVKLWRLNGAEELATFTVNQGWIGEVIFSKDGKTIISSGEDDTIHLWDVATRRAAGVLRGHKGSVLSLALSPDGRVLASGGEDQTVRLWNMDTRQEIAALRGPAHPVLGLEFSPDGAWLASPSGPENKARLWDVAQRRPATLLTGHHDLVGSATFSPDSQLLATVSNDNTARLWEVATGRPIAELRGHSGWVESAAFAPDGKTLATSGHDGAVKLWSVIIRQEVAELPGFCTPFSELHFSPDGNTLSAHGADGVVRLWHAAPRADANN